MLCGRTDGLLPADRRRGPATGLDCLYKGVRMPDQRRVPKDRRNEEDRRRVYDVDHFESADRERRRFRERRSPGERRFDWVRIGNWMSMLARALGLKQSGQRETKD